MPYIKKLMRKGSEFPTFPHLQGAPAGDFYGNEIPADDVSIQLYNCPISEYQYKNSVMVQSRCARKLKENHECIALLIKLEMG